MTDETLLGLPLEEAVRRLQAEGVEPEILISRAPRRPQGYGALRVVRVTDGGRKLTACGFSDLVKDAEEKGDGGKMDEA